MNDEECSQIQAKAIIHLICCAFDDYRITTLELDTALKELKKGMVN